MPFELWGWTDEFNAPKDEMMAWMDFDPVGAIGKIVLWKILADCRT